jgi:hypothetical protein
VNGGTEYATFGLVGTQAVFSVDGTVTGGFLLTIAASSGTTANLTIQGQAAGAGNDAGGNVNINGGAASGSGTAGGVELTTGDFQDQVSLGSHLLIVTLGGFIGAEFSTSSSPAPYGAKWSLPAGGSSPGAALVIASQNAGGSNHNGGSLALLSGTGTGSGVPGAATLATGDNQNAVGVTSGLIEFLVSGINVANISFGGIVLETSRLVFDSSVASPAFGQEAGSGAGQNLTIGAQSAGGSNNGGGNIVLQGGGATGSGTPGGIFLFTGDSSDVLELQNHQLSLQLSSTSVLTISESGAVAVIACDELVVEGSHGAVTTVAPSGSTGTIDTQAQTFDKSVGTVRIVSSATPVVALTYDAPVGTAGVGTATIISKAVSAGTGIAVGDMVYAVYTFGYKYTTGGGVVVTSATLIATNNTTASLAVAFGVVAGAITGTILLSVTGNVTCTVDVQVSLDIAIN